MPKNRYYHFDHESCSFVEVKPTPARLYLHVTALAVVVLLVAGALAMGFDHFMGTPEELALRVENEALQEQLQATTERITEFSEELEELSEADQDLYRLLLQADPISGDVRQMGVGGNDPYEEFNRFSEPTAQLLRETTQKLDQIERQIGLQNTSFRELAGMVEDHEAWLAQMPAIMPTNGRVTSGFGMRHHPILKIIRMHPGIDIPVQRGTPVYATGDGIVKEAGRSSGGYGLHVVIDHPKAGYRTLYAHLSKIPARIQPGRRVQRGEQIALSGNTGLSKAPHLHYEVRDLEDRLLNPVHFFAPSMTPKQYQVLLKETERSTISLD